MRADIADDLEWRLKVIWVSVTIIKEINYSFYINTSSTKRNTCTIYVDVWNILICYYVWSKTTRNLQALFTCIPCCPLSNSSSLMQWIHSATVAATTKLLQPSNLEWPSVIDSTAERYSINSRHAGNCQVLYTGWSLLGLYTGWPLFFNNDFPLLFRHQKLCKSITCRRQCLTVSDSPWMSATESQQLVKCHTVNHWFYIKLIICPNSYNTSMTLQAFP